MATVVDGAQIAGGDVIARAFDDHRTGAVLPRCDPHMRQGVAHVLRADGGGGNRDAAGLGAAVLLAQVVAGVPDIVEPPLRQHRPRGHDRMQPALARKARQDVQQRRRGIEQRPIHRLQMA